MVPGSKVALLAGRVKPSRSLAALRLIPHDGVNCDAPGGDGEPFGNHGSDRLLPPWERGNLC